MVVNKKLSSIFSRPSHHAVRYDFILGSIKSVYNMLSS